MKELTTDEAADILNNVLNMLIDLDLDMHGKREGRKELHIAMKEIVRFKCQWFDQARRQNIMGGQNREISR